MKRCTVCNELKPLDEFPRNKYETDGRRYECKPCANMKMRAWRKNNPDAVKKAKRRQHLMQEYGLSIDKYEQLLHEQNNACAICETPAAEAPPAGRRLAVDHCHTTDAVRGLLCGPCNSAIGLLKESPDNLRRAIAYLEEWNTRAS